MTTKGKGGDPLILTDFCAEVAYRRRMRLPTKIFHSLLRGDREVVRLGARWLLDYNTMMGKRIIKQSGTEHAEIQYFFPEASARDCKIFLDIGAHIGFYSVVGARMDIFEEIHAVEPTWDSFKRLQWHIRANGFDDLIRAYRIAASDRPREILMLADEAAFPPTRREFSTVKRVTEVADARESENTARAQAASLDSLFEFEGKTLAVKMDVEGHEIPALIGGKNLFAKNRVFLQIEVWPTNMAVVYYLLANGFQLLTYLGSNFYFDNERTV